eukprot:PhM_4_TR11972/c0_g1_i1/m.83895/K14406/CSTF1; cleavage stimulation factor subunit 1
MSGGADTSSSGAVDDDQRQLYQMIAAQLQHDGHFDAARAVSRSTMCTSLPMNDDPCRLLALTRLGLHTEALGGTGGYLSRIDYNNLPSVENFVGDIGSAHPQHHHISDERWSRFTEKYVSSSKQPVRCVTYSPDGLYAASGSTDGVLRLYDVPGMHRQRHNALQKQQEDQQQQHDDHKHAKDSGNVSGGAVEGGTAASVGADTAQILRTYLDHRQAVTAVAFHPTNALVLSGGRDGRIIMYSYTHASSTTPVKTVDDTYPIRGLCVHPSGKHIVYTTDHPAIRFYDLESGQLYTNLGSTGGGPSATSTEQHTNVVWDVDVSADGRRFATGSADGSLRLWDGLTGHMSQLKSKAHCGADVTSTKFSRGGDYLLTSGRDGRAIIWDLRMYHTPVKTLGTPQRTSQRSRAVFSFREDLVIANVDLDDSMVLVYDIRLQQLNSKAVHPAGVRGLASSPVEQSYITGCDDYCVRLWGPAV